VIYEEEEIERRMKQEEEVEKEEKETAELMRKSSLKSKYSKMSQPHLYGFSSPRLAI
jgi:hypothetical protein